jgi:hypothetical protein
VTNNNDAINESRPLDADDPPPLQGSDAASASGAADAPCKSVHHAAFQQLMRDKLESGLIFGSSWRSFFGFFAPFGTSNSFWSRLQKSPSFKHLFVYDESVLDKCVDASISAELGRGRVRVADVDAVVNNTSLICALVISIPLMIMGELGSNNENWSSLMQSLQDKSTGAPFCLPSSNSSFLYSTFCTSLFSFYYKRLFLSTILCFYTACASLFMAVYYYMCRPSEGSNCMSMMELFEAFKIEVRDNFRRQRQTQQLGAHSKSDLGTDAQVAEVLRRLEDNEVMFHAKFLAENKMQELKNHEFYMWYKSENCDCVSGQPSLCFFVFVPQFHGCMVPSQHVASELILYTDTLASGGRFVVLCNYVGMITTTGCAIWCVT